MIRIRFNNKKIFNILLVLLIIVFTYFYFILILKTKFNNYINNQINSKYDFNTYKISDNLFYSPIIDSIEHKEYDIYEYKVVNISKSEIVKENGPIVYIYNSHDTEKYSLPFISDYSIVPTVKHSSYMLKEHLNKLGISSTVESRSINSYLKKHNLNYYGCYDASRSYIKEALKKYDYKILLDIHRDSVKRKYTLFTYKDKKYAKVLFVLTTKHKDYKKNEKFVNYLNNYINKKYKGLSRGIMKRKDVIFNQDLSNNAILIEVGGIDNTIEELNNTLSVISEALYEYIKEKKYD